MKVNSKKEEESLFQSRCHISIFCSLGLQVLDDYQLDGQAVHQQEASFRISESDPLGEFSMFRVFRAGVPGVRARGCSGCSRVSSGTYRCEVTAVVRPRRGMNIQGFEMKESINKMVVVELPSSQPQISGGNLKIKYKPGDALNLTCTSAPSNPPASLEWIVNNKKVRFAGNFFWIFLP